MDALHLVDTWPVTAVATAAIAPSGAVSTHGEVERAFPLASVTKPLFAYACLVAIEEGSLDLHTPDDTGTTVADLLAHTAGWPFEGEEPRAPLRTRRLYSNTGFERLGRRLRAATGFEPAEYLAAAVFEPLGMATSSLEGSPAHAGVSSVADLVRFVAELRSPTLISRSTLDTATTPFEPELRGVVPGFGQHDPCPWGLGFEIRGRKTPHWTGRGNSPETFGHFGAAGTFLWVDPVAGCALLALTDRRFGPWAASAWPLFADAVLDEMATLRR